MSLWIVPGAPLEQGNGWRIWFSSQDAQPFQPTDVRVTRQGNQESTQQVWNLLPVVQDLARRVGVLTVTLDHPVPGAMYEITIRDLQPPQTFSWRTLPVTMGDEGVSFLFASCFWRNDDKEGFYSRAVRDLTKLERPAFKLLIGDQVYQDWPPTPGTSMSEVELYAARYAEYWGDGGYQEVLRSSPNFFMCDDHEFWNDYPETQRHLDRTWTPPWDPHRKTRYGQAASILYDYFQRAANGTPDPWYQFKVGGVSFFVADTRSQRTEYAKQPHSFIPHDEWTALEQWQQELRCPGVLVLGQPLYQKDGDFKDHSLSNFQEDYGRLCALIERSFVGENIQKKPHAILMLSGDIHTGRYCFATTSNLPREKGLDRIPELIASPASMIVPGDTEFVQPPQKFTPTHKGKTTVWEINLDDRSSYFTLDNNIGVVRMTQGRQDRVRFELSLWRVRPSDKRSYWEKLVGKSRKSGPLIRAFYTTIELP